MTSAESTSINGHDLGENPFAHPEAGERNADHPSVKAEAQNVTEKRCKKWAARSYPVVALREIREPWARSLAAEIERRDAGRDPVTTPPRLMFKGDDAVKAGATDAQIAALPALSPGDTAMLKLRAAAMRQADRRQVDVMARQIAAGRDNAVTPPDPVALGDLLNEPDEGATYRIGEMWPSGGRVLLAAQFKSGKSTLVGNVIRALVDGGPFLGRFDVTPVAKVALIDTELDRRTLRRWLRDQDIRNSAGVSVLPLRGAVSTFDILDPATRSEWARRLAGSDVIILDCLRPVLDALALSEDKDAGRLLVAFDALLAEAGADEGMVVTHMGHQNERARGDSRLLDWNDAMWKIVRDGDDTDDDGTRRRYLSALGRDVAVPEGLITFDPSTRHLTYAGGNRRDSASLAAMPELLALVRAHPGTLSKRQTEDRLCNAHGVTQKDARRAIQQAIADGTVIVAIGPRRAQLLSPGVDPAEQINPFDLADGE